MEIRIIVAQCGRDKDLNILEEGTHLAEAIYMENQPEGTGWFIPLWCPACEEEKLRQLEDPEYRKEIDEYLLGPEFTKATDAVESFVAFKRIMNEE